MNLMVLGAVAMACLIVSLFFLRFWETTRDRFFLYFALSFTIMGLDRIISGLFENLNTQEPLFYLLRLGAFLIIIWAIIDKNWLRKRKPDASSGGR